MATRHSNRLWYFCAVLPVWGGGWLAWLEIDPGDSRKMSARCTDQIKIYISIFCFHPMTLTSVTTLKICLLTLLLCLVTYGSDMHCREHAFIRETNRTKAQAEHIKVMDRKWHHSLAYPDCAVTEKKERRKCTLTPDTHTHHGWKRRIRLQHSKRKIIKF